MRQLRYGGGNHLDLMLKIGGVAEQNFDLSAPIHADIGQIGYVDLRDIYGTTARIARSAMRKLRENGLKVGLIRPITLWPFPNAPIQKAAKHAKAFLTVEMSMGQMVDDVRLAVNGQKPVSFYGRTGGIVPSVREIVEQVEALAKEAE